jgi:hypothetical protein
MSHSITHFIMLPSDTGSCHLGILCDLDIASGYTDLYREDLVLPNLRSLSSDVI